MSEDRDRTARGAETRSSYWRDIRERREEILSVREEMMKRRTWLAAAIDRSGDLLAHPVFFSAMLLSHLAWLLLNTGWIPGVDPWDPYPFMMLATITSAEAPFIALVILMRQSRDQRIDELREEVSLQVELHMERETSRALRMLVEIQDHLGIERDDDELDRMLDPVDTRDILRDMRERLDEAEGRPAGETDD